MTTRVVHPAGATPPGTAPFRPLENLRLVRELPDAFNVASSAATLEVRALADTLFRITIVPSPAPTLPQPAQPTRRTPAMPRRDRNRVQLATAEATLTVHLRSGACTLADRQHLELAAFPAGETGLAGGQLRLSLALRERERLHGLGAAPGPFNRRGSRWQIRVPTPGDPAGPHPASIRPWLLSLRDGRASGLWLESPALQTWDLGHTRQDRLQIWTTPGPARVYLATGPTARDVLAQLTGQARLAELPHPQALHPCHTAAEESFAPDVGQPDGGASGWDYLRDAVPRLLNLGLSGVAQASAPWHSVLGDPTPELYLRWLHLAAVSSPVQSQPWIGGSPRSHRQALSREHLDAARQYLHLGRQLTPCLRGLAAEAARLGAPLLRPLLWRHANDPEAAACGDAFLLGEALLVAPVIHQGAEARSVYLPRGEWFDFWTGARLEGGAYRNTRAPAHHLPLFIRAGGILPMAATSPSLSGHARESLFLHLWPEGTGGCTWVDPMEPSGADAVRDQREIVAQSSARRGRITISGRTGPPRRAVRPWRVLIRNARRNLRVAQDGAVIPSDYFPEFGIVVFDITPRESATEISWRG